MKTKMKRERKISKGAPSGFIISLGVHAAAFMLAGLFVVFTVHKKEEQKFVPPQIAERPKMQLRKPQVKVAKKTPQNKATQRIVSKVPQASMPEIALPEMTGFGVDSLAGLGGFDLAADAQQVTLFGSGGSIGNDFVGTFYDFNRSRTGRNIPMNTDQFVHEVGKFTRNGWKPSTLSQYYRSPQKLHTTSFMIPPIRSSVAPSAFGEADTAGYTWMAHYKGQLVYPEDTRIRFWGQGDDILLVRVNGEIVLNASWPDGEYGTYNIGHGWNSQAQNDARFYLGNNTMRGGDWIDLKAGEPLDMEVLLGEVPGGTFTAMLTVEVDGEDYPRNRQGGPILPMFKTEVPSADLVDIIYRDMPEGEADIIGGPVFRDFGTVDAARSMMAWSVPDPGDDFIPDSGYETVARVWMVDDREFGGEYVATFGDRIVLRDERGKKHRIPVSQLSPVDREYLELERAPEFSIAFTQRNSARHVETSPYLDWDVPPRVRDFTFGARVSQKNAARYDHELTVEYFAVAQQLSGDRYILVERNAETFIPSAENKRSHAFSGKEIEFIDYNQDDSHRGMIPSDYIVTISDKRGKVIQHRASSTWLYENLENLKRLPVGAYMDRTGIRVPPSRPKATYY